MKIEPKLDKRKKIILIFIAIALSIEVVLASWFFVSLNQPPKSEDKPPVVVKKPMPTKLTSKVLFTGNIFWGRYIDDWSMKSPLKYAYPFSRLDEFKREDYNAWVAGLECPVVDGVNTSSYEMDQTLQFNCKPEYLSEAAKWFNIFNLANNHTDNQNGKAGLIETRQQLDSNKIQYFGHYDPREYDETCEVIGLPVSVVQDDGSQLEGYLPVAMCGYHGFIRLPDETAVSQISRYSKYLPVIAMPHMGVEYRARPDQLKTSFNRSLIDAGADMVIGDHPHWVQPAESYKGKLIVYSMGNFIFDQQYNQEVTRSALISVSMETRSTSSANLKKWLSLGEQCLTYSDNCLEEISQSGLPKLDIKYTFSILGSDNGHKLTKPATSAQLDGILNRLNWSSVKNKLKDPYFGL